MPAVTAQASGRADWYMSPGIVAEGDLKGNLTSEYVFFDGERVARKDFPGNAVSHYFSDHLKTASVITDSAGIIKSESDYYPWGGELQFVNSDSNHYKYGGHERDNETGLDYMLARYYSNPLGRFLTPDWSTVPVPVPYADLSNPQTLNQYAFARNNPTSLDDPDGHDPPGDAQVVGTLISAAIACAAAEPCGAGAAVVGVVAAPVLGMVVVAAAPPTENHPADDPPNAADMMLDALNPPYVPAPPLPTTHPGQTTTVDTATPAATSQAGTVDANAQRASEGSKGGPTAGERFKPSDRAQDAGKACAYCGQKTTEKAGRPNSRETDHVYPKSRGGNTTPRNRAPACRTCNRSKGPRIPKEWRKAQKAKEQQ